MFDVSDSSKTVRSFNNASIALRVARRLDNAEISIGDRLLATVNGGALHVEQSTLDAIERLREEAAAAGDEAMERNCDVALEDDDDTALALCLDAIDSAAAMAG